MKVAVKTSVKETGKIVVKVGVQVASMMASSTASTVTVASVMTVKASTPNFFAVRSNSSDLKVTTPDQLRLAFVRSSHINVLLFAWQN